MAIELTVVTPEGEAYSGAVEEVVGALSRVVGAGVVVVHHASPEGAAGCGADGEADSEGRDALSSRVGGARASRSLRRAAWRVTPTWLGVLPSASAIRRAFFWSSRA